MGRLSTWKALQSSERVDYPDLRPPVKMAQALPKERNMVSLCPDLKFKAIQNTQGRD